MNLVVSDTSPIRALGNAGLLHVLDALFDRIVIPPAVFAELTSPQSSAVPLHRDQLKFCEVIDPFG